MAKSILIFAEQRQGKLKRSVLELIGLGQELAGGGSVHVALAGHGVGALADELAQHGVASVRLADDASLAAPLAEAYVAVLVEAAAQTQASLVLLPATAMGRDLAPRLAGRLQAALVSECQSLEASGDGYRAKKGMYGGKTLATVEVSGGGPVVATVKPGAHAPAPHGATGAISKLAAPTVSSRASFLGYVEGGEEEVDLQEAEIVVSAGRGLKGPENLHLVEALAKALGGAVGASRAIVDAGWIAHHHQVGQTGVAVTPKLYVACGISGAIQHLAGMRGSQCIVAINKDADAPIFKVADYGIVGDVFEVLPALTAEVRKAREGA